MRIHKTVVIILCLLVYSLAPTLAVAQETGGLRSTMENDTLKEAEELLQKGLTIYEIDQEVARLSKKESDYSAQIDFSLQNIQKQDILVQKTRERAGRVIRAYYTGERESVWLLLFAARSFSDALNMIEYLFMIIEHDYRAIRTYLQTSRELKQMHTELVQAREILREIKVRFMAERERLITLQKELDEELKTNPEAEKLALQIKQLTELWETKGIVFFKKYFDAFTQAMKHFPEMIANNKNILLVDGLNYTFQLTDAQLMQFLEQKDPLFKNFTFGFQQDRIVVEGQQDDIRLTITGHYILEDKPVNSLKFHIDDLIFNGFTLPDTTRNSMQEQFDLAFYPNKLASFLVATGVQMEPGWLKVKLKMKMGSE
jgi:peptidoglycan hydrolase CwlO-like protein